MKEYLITRRNTTSFFILGILKLPSKFPLENSIEIVETFEATDLIIEIGDYIFEDIERHYFPDGEVQLHFGKVLKYPLTMGKLNLNLIIQDLICCQML